ncbi:unnamed protein product [Urochloa humidicola]
MDASRAEEFLRSRDGLSRKQSSSPARWPTQPLGGMQLIPTGRASRKQLSPTRPAGSGSGSSMPAAGSKYSTEPPPPPPSWLVLDRFVHRSRRRYGVVDGDATASATSSDCIGRPVSASLRIAASPAVSRLYLHWPGRPSIQGMRQPDVIAAHSRSILFKVYVPFSDPHCHRPCFFPVDYFVYSASLSPELIPELTRLPVCKEGVDTVPDDKYFQPYRRQQQRIMVDQAMGLLCTDIAGGFTVADLTESSYHDVELCVLHHQPPGPGRSAKFEWSVERLQIPPDMCTRGLNLSTFDFDVVIPIHGCFFAWVDFYQGMLLVDVLHAHVDPQLRFIPLPAEALLSRRVCIDGCCPDPGTQLASWTLVDMDQGVWEKDGTTMGDMQFWGLYAGLNLPRVQPSFPLVSLVDPVVICFLLKEEDNHNFWMIEVNMGTKALQSSAIYINEEEEERYSSKKTPKNFFDGHCFIPCKFSAYLEKDAITR